MLLLSYDAQEFEISNQIGYTQISGAGTFFFLGGGELVQSLWLARLVEGKYTLATHEARSLLTSIMATILESLQTKLFKSSSSLPCKVQLSHPLFIPSLFTLCHSQP